MSSGLPPRQKDIPTILTIFKLYEQQKYMYDNKVHKVENRIVSISQSWIRPIVRGNVKAPVEFGAKWISVLMPRGMQGLKVYPLMTTMKAPACRTLLMLIMGEPDTIRNGFLQIRYIG